jgi:hypothetical protein
MMKSSMSSQSKDILKLRLSAMNWDGIDGSIAPASFDYCGSWVGRDFKTFIQVAPYVCKDLITPEFMEVLVALASLSKYCYAGDISQDTLQSHAQSVHTSVLNLISKINLLPSHLKQQLTGKVKIHLLCHIAYCIRRFGPPHLFCTEKEESLNQETRFVISTSNRHAYSLHTAQRFTHFQCMELLLNGLFFHDDIYGWMRVSDQMMSMRSILLKESSQNESDFTAVTRIYGDRIIDSSGYSTAVGGFILFKTNSNTSIILRILQIVKVPSLIIAAKCSKISSDAFNNSVFQITTEIEYIGPELLSRIESVVNMQHVCDESCKSGIVQRKIENKLRPCIQMIHSMHPKYVFNSFCFSMKSSCP